MSDWDWDWDWDWGQPECGRCGAALPYEVEPMGDAGMPVVFVSGLCDCALVEHDQAALDEQPAQGKEGRS